MPSGVSRWEGPHSMFIIIAFSTGSVGDIGFVLNLLSNHALSHHPRSLETLVDLGLEAV